MYNKETDRDWMMEFAVAALAASVVTSFAVARGQNPWMAMGITLFSSSAAVLINRLI
jgi:hypothetical protein